MVLGLALAWSAANLMLAYDHFLLAKGLLVWDETFHSLQGLRIAQDLRNWDLLAFLYDSYRQVYWPPAFSWISAGFFLVLGPSTETARLASLASLLPLPAVLFLAARRLRPARPWLAGSVAMSLAATSASMADYASEAMLEGPGLLVLGLSLWLYFRFLDRPSRPAAVILALAVVLTYLTKSNYGVVLALAVTLGLLLDASFKLRAAFLEPPARHIFMTLGGALLLWFAYPPKLRNTWMALVNYPFGPDAYGLDGLLFYPRALAAAVGPVWLVALLLGAAVLSLARLSDRKVRFLVLFLVIQFGLATWSHTKMERHILTMLPPLFLLGAYWLSGLGNWLLDRRSRLGAAAAGLLAVLLLGGLSQDFYSRVSGPPVQVEPAAYQAGELVSYLTSLGREGEPLLFTASLEMVAYSFDWYLATEANMPVDAAGSLVQTGEGELQGALVRALPPPLRGPLDRLQRRSQTLGVNRTLYAGMPMDAPLIQTENEYAEAIGQAAARYWPRGVALIQARADAEYFQRGEVQRVLLGLGYQAGEVRTFDPPGATVRLYFREGMP